MVSALEEVVAIEEIRRLKARFFLAVDDKDWATYAALFTDDARFDVADAFEDAAAEFGDGIAGAAAVAGGEAMARLVERLLANTATIHIGYMPVITVSGPDDASAIWPVEDWLWLPEGSDPAVLHGFGRYRDRYVRTAKGWKIARLGYHRERFT